MKNLKLIVNDKIKHFKTIAIIVCTLIGTAGHADITPDELIELKQRVELELTRGIEFNPDTDMEKMYSARDYDFILRKGGRFLPGVFFIVGGTDQLTFDKGSVLHLAIAAQNTRVLQLLLKHPKVNVNILNAEPNNERSLTPLTWCVAFKNITAFELLVKNEKSNLNMLDRLNNSTMYYIIQQDSYEKGKNPTYLQMAKILLNAPQFDINFILKTPYELETTTSYLLILSSSVNLNFNFVDAFLRHPKLNLEAPENRRGTYKIINEEIDLFQNKTISNLYWVNYLFNDSKFQFMAKDRLSNSAIESVASFRDLNLLKKAISKYSGDINDIVGAFGKNLLENAVYETDIELAKFLIQLGMDVNRKDNSGNNILHRISHTSSDAGDTLQMINYLLTLGLDINNNAFIIDLINFGSDSSAVVLNLIQRPYTDINIVNNLGQSILVKMISYNYPLDVIETLLKLPKFNINYRDNKSGFTALGFITEYQRDYKQPQEIIALLKKYGAQL